MPPKAGISSCTREPEQEGCVFIEVVNEGFIKAGGTPDQFRAGIARAVASAWPLLHEFGTYVKFTPAGAELFARYAVRVIPPKHGHPQGARTVTVQAAH